MNFVSAFRKFGKNMVQEDKYLKEELLGAISDLFLTYGLRSTSMEDICNHLKISKKTLYQIFENKDDVVEQVMHYRLEKRQQENAPGELSRMSPIRFLCNMKKHIIKDIGTQLPANYFDIKKYHPEVYKRIQTEETEFMEALMEMMLEKGVKEGVLRQDADMKLQLYLLIQQFMNFREKEMINSVGYPASVLISTVVDNFILAISTVKGVKEFEKIQKEEKKI